MPPLSNRLPVLATLEKIMHLNHLSIPLALFALFLLGAFALGESDADDQVLLGKGDQTYRWVRAWGALADGDMLGSTHGAIVTDKAGRIFVNTDTKRAVMIFSPEGKLLDSWGTELAGGLHGMTIVEEKNDTGESQEFLYLAHIGKHQVYKTTLDGEILWTLPYPAESGIYKSAEEYKPTSIAVAPDGRFFVADGYGKSFVHRYAADRTWLGSFGGPGSVPGKMHTPHGISIDMRAGEPRLLVADRENHRLQTFSLEGELLGVIEGDLRRPCFAQQRGDLLVVADLGGRVTILDGDNHLVTHLGDQPDPSKRAQYQVPVADWVDGQFLAPHCAHWDKKGNLYVMDWNFRGRVTKLERVH